MNYLFLDNFRGFSKTLLSIRDVNFLVGENSTGKTSILALINILDSPELWIYQRFRSDEVSFGNFKDIVSINSLDKSYFRIGLVETDSQRSDKKTEIRNAFLMTFVEEEGMPTLSKYTCLMGGEQFKVNFSAKTVKFKSEGTCEMEDDRESINRILLSWVDGHQQADTGYKSVRIAFARREALVFISAYLAEMAKKRVSRRTPRHLELRLPLAIPRPFQNVVWLAPIRTKPQRTYDSYRLDFSPEGDHTPYLIKKLLTRRTREQREQAERFVSFIKRFGRDSSLFESISVKDYDRRSTTSPFELDIVLSREALSIDNVGYGVSQALPIIVELFAQPKGTWFAIQQPEIHLHPRAQEALGEAMFELAVTENKKFIVETHSDFTVDGFRLNYRRRKIRRKPDSQIIFFERNPRGNVLHEIKILGNGELPDTQPKAYRDFFIKQQMRMLGY